MAIGKAYVRWKNNDNDTGNLIKLKRTFNFSDISDDYASKVLDIRFNYDLKGATIVLPENITLRISGGGFKNGTIVGNNTVVLAGKVPVFDADVELDGTFNNTEVYTQWFGALANGLFNDTQAILKSLSVLNTGVKLIFSGYFIIDAGVIDVSDFNNLTLDFTSARVNVTNTNGFCFIIRNFKTVTVLGGDLHGNQSLFLNKDVSGFAFVNGEDLTIKKSILNDFKFALTSENVSGVSVNGCKGSGVKRWNETDNNNKILSSSFIYVTDCNDVDILNSYSFRYAHHILSNANTKNIRVDGNIIEESLDSSIYITSGGNTITNNKIFKAGKDGIKSNGLSNGLTEGIEDNNNVNGNYIEGCGLEKSDGGTAIALGGFKSIISNNIIKFPDLNYVASLSGVVIFGKSTHVTDNIITGFSSGEDGVLTGVVLKNGANTSDSIISRNTFIKNRIALASGGANNDVVKSNVEITDNKIIDSYRGIQILQDTKLSKHKGFSIERNHFKNITDNSIVVKRTKDLILAGNTGVDLGNIFITDIAGENTSVIDNKIDNGTLYYPSNAVVDGETLEATTLLKKGNYVSIIPQELEPILPYLYENKLAKINKAKGVLKAFTGGKSGAIKIAIPSNRTFKDVKFKVSIYNLVENKAIDVTVSAMMSTTWVAPSVVIHTGGKNPYKIRLGKSDDKKCLWIGDIGDNWQNLLVSVSDILIGDTHGTFPFSDDWLNNWAVDVVSSFGDVDHVLENNMPYGDYNKLINKMPVVTTENSSSRTLTKNDAGGIIVLNNVLFTSVTIPKNSNQKIDIGEKITLVNTSPVTINILKETTVQLIESTATTIAPNTSIVIQKIAINTWIVIGN